MVFEKIRRLEIVSKYEVNRAVFFLRLQNNQNNEILPGQNLAPLEVNQYTPLRELAHAILTGLASRHAQYELQSDTYMTKNRQCPKQVLFGHDLRFIPFIYRYKVNALLSCSYELAGNPYLI